MLDTLKTGVARVPDDEQVKLQDGFNYLTGRADVDPSHIGSVGFCWGGARSFTFATRNPDLWAAVVFYGSTPPFDDLNNIQAPVLGLYGSLDNNSPTSITGRAAETAREMRARKRSSSGKSMHLRLTVSSEAIHLRARGSPTLGRH
jgi:carboxymethylenebutenolidase